MRFVTPPQSISEYRHRKMPAYETMAAIGVGAAVGIAGAGASYGLSKLGGGGGGSFPSFGDIANQALQYSKGFTKKNIALQDLVTPGSSQQRELANQQLNAYIQGQIPQDVQQNIQRQVAQGLGGGYNMFSGGGQAPQNFARNIGQTSVGLSQFGLSAAPTWQQLANSMVTTPGQLMGAATGIAENQYQAQQNQYLQNQQQIQSAVNTGVGMAGMATGVMNSNQLGGYYNTMAKFGGLPSYAGATNYMNSLGYSTDGFTQMTGNKGDYSALAALYK